MSELVAVIRAPGPSTGDGNEFAAFGSIVWLLHIYSQPPPIRKVSKARVLRRRKNRDHWRPHSTSSAKDVLYPMESARRMADPMQGFHVHNRRCCNNQEDPRTEKSATKFYRSIFGRMIIATGRPCTGATTPRST